MGVARCLMAPAAGGTLGADRRQRRRQDAAAQAAQRRCVADARPASRAAGRRRTQLYRGGPPARTRRCQAPDCLSGRRTAGQICALRLESARSRPGRDRTASYGFAVDAGYAAAGPARGGRLADLRLAAARGPRVLLALLWTKASGPVGARAGAGSGLAVAR